MFNVFMEEGAHGNKSAYIPPKSQPGHRANFVHRVPVQKNPLLVKLLPLVRS